MSLPLLLRPARRRKWDYDLTAGTLPPVLSVARASTGTRVNAAGLIVVEAANAPRFDFDPVALACRGLLLEPQATNLCVQSRAFATAPWAIGGGTLTANAVAGVDGTTVADTWQYADAAYRWRDDTAAAFVTATTAYSIGAGWTRITSTVTAPAGCTTLRYYAARSDAPSRFVYCVISCTPGQTYTASHYAQTSGAGMALDAAQIEAGSVATSWIQTTGTVLTRDLDGLTLSDTSRAVEFTYLPLAGGAAQTVQVAAGAQPSGIYGWVTRVRQL